ncbi:MULTISPECIES: PP2C family protein-serine/threonine phosphatase [Streptomyces]|uniref:Protein phosphatase n=1 Tax=Streptomyces clavifer TaxID=68188 RepID=A0ABS4VHX3_9ACTN|nr:MULTISPECIES: protein phosphatase 2C domain-containing protein [Streptomyces]MBP2363353.1 protein phosphatase [Streptomyces clavifer]MDX2748499.1 protein phosphatase 2C domain-containing protein [Streptomyces sp. NRRL_B-2557]GHB30882.1 serine/threonine protein phosphatase [Streptomyces clavifer]
MPVRWMSATATDQGPRRVMADAAAAYRNRANGHRAWSVADGIGDDYEPAYAARSAARISAQAATRGGAAYGIATARRLLQYEYEGAPRGQAGDAVMVTALPFPDAAGGGFDIAWVGDCRAYTVRGGALYQETDDHTQGAAMRQSATAWSREIAPGYDHVVTRSVVRDTEIASVRITGPVERLLLCSDGVSKVLPAGVVAEILTGTRCAARAARALVAAARSCPSARDNIAVTVLTPGHGRQHAR